MEEIMKLSDNILLKRWLYSFCFVTFFGLMNSIIFIPKIFNNPGNSVLSNGVWITIICITLILGMLFSYLLYYCAYKKRGDMYLLLVLITSPFHLYRMTSDLSALYSLEGLTFGLLSNIVLQVGWCVMVYYDFFLWKANRKIRHEHEKKFMANYKPEQAEVK